jgi:hypothetical protein
MFSGCIVEGRREAYLAPPYFFDRAPTPLAATARENQRRRAGP